MVKFLKVIRFFSNKLLYKYFFHNIRTVRKLSKSPIVVCGCPRSGTTLLISILDSHPKIHVIPFETGVLNYRAKHKRVFKNEGLHFAFSKFQILAYLFSTKIKNTANRWSEKHPFNIINVSEINRMYRNNIKIINMIRDGRDVVSSKHKRLGYIATPKLWYKAIQEARKFELKDNFISIRYEDLVLNPQKELEKVVKFLDLECDFDMNDWVTKSSIAVNLKKSIVTGKEMPFELSHIKANSIGNWKKKVSPYIEEFLNSPDLMNLNNSLGYN